MIEIDKQMAGTSREESLIDTKPSALELGKYRLEYGDFPEEVFQQFVELEEMAEETKKILRWEWKQCWQ